MDGTMKRTPEQSAELDECARRCNYVEPPDHLVPSRGPGEDPKGWDALWEYFDDHCASANDAVLVFFASRFGCSIGEAYVHTDGYFKARNAVDEDGRYWSYN
jgi:hypothetical protein